MNISQSFSEPHLHRLLPGCSQISTSGCQQDCVSVSSPPNTKPFFSERESAAASLTVGVSHSAEATKWNSTKKSVYLPPNVRWPQNQLKAHLVDWSNAARSRVTHAHKHTNAASPVHTFNRMRWFVRWVETWEPCLEPSGEHLEPNDNWSRGEFGLKQTVTKFRTVQRRATTGGRRKLFPHVILNLWPQNNSHIKKLISHPSELKVFILPVDVVFNQSNPDLVLVCYQVTR